MTRGPQEGVEEGERLKDLSLVWFAGASYNSNWQNWVKITFLPNIATIIKID